MNSVASALREQGAAIRDGGLDHEADSRLNDSNRSLIAAMLEECPSVYLGIVNARSEDGVLWAWVWQHHGATVYNFGADFVLPTGDVGKLRRILEERHQAPYEGPKKDAIRIEAIYDEVFRLGGHVLVWS